MTSTPGDDLITAIIGRTETGKKVHMGFKRTNETFCASTPTAPVMTRTIAVLPEPGGRDQTIATLLQHNIHPQSLCAHCFSISIRSAYVRAVREALQATANTTVTVAPDATQRGYVTALHARRQNSIDGKETNA